ncbi:LysR family transcriptional regulator [Pantoea stewartii]|uniref:LysR family transcriptional regulator n=1 Tax=Pantoea stewartii TaxID=66269 RepID=UPI00197F8F98|nr:LysR family transcriptional regulator [Pantoea stewartii]
MDTIEAMRVFVAVAEHNSFSAAADAMNLSSVSVTRQIVALEKRLNTRLLNRTTRRVSLTSAGAAYYLRVVKLLAELNDIEAEVSAHTLVPAGLLRITAPVGFGIEWLGPVLAGFNAIYPQVKLDLSLNDRMVDMVEEGFDISIRITNQPAPHLIARKLTDSRVLLCASPEYLARAGTPLTPSDLTEHACLAYSYVLAGENWSLHSPSGKVIVPVNGTLRANNGYLLREAALAGMGIVREPEFVVAQALAEGRLVQVLPDWSPPPIGIYAVYTSRNHLAPKVRSFIDWLVKAFESPRV